jgi:pimeloyl-ACP methyl ester carboxylesterase
LNDGLQTIDLPGGFEIAVRLRRGDGDESIVFIHGFGSAKEHFRRAFDSPPLAGYTLIAVDLVGFGRSRGPERFDYTMAEQARVALQVLDRLDVRTFHLCAHSMGGLVAMRLAEQEPERALSLIDMEGNLTPEDCFFSGRVAGFTSQEFAEKGKRKIESKLREAGREDASIREHAETFAMASTDALYKSAVHMVADSSAPQVEMLSQIKNACYIYGERNRGVYPAEKLLKAAGIPIFYIEDAGHSMATENPDQLYRVIGDFINDVRPIPPEERGMEK